MALWVTERARSVRHVAKVLYHWRILPESVANNAAAKPYAYEAGRRAVQDHCDRTGRRATVTDGVVPGVYRVRRDVEGEPLVCVVIPTRGSRSRVWGVDRCFVVDSPQDARKDFCRQARPWKDATDVKFLVVYPLPWGLQTSATYQNVSGPTITASYTANNAHLLFREKEIGTMEQLMVTPIVAVSTCVTMSSRSSARAARLSTGLLVST